MHLDVTLDDIFEEKQEICGNTASLEFCLAVRFTRATLGTLRTDNCDVRDNVAEMNGFWVGDKEKGPHPSSNRDGRIYRFAVPVPK